MKKKKIVNAMLLAGCLTACLASGCVLTGCTSEKKVVVEGSMQFVEEAEKVGPQFLEGALAEVYVEDTIVLSEYIEYVDDSDYTITITDKNGNVEDMTHQIIWIPYAPGEYVLTYTIASGESKGTSTFTFSVSYPELSWEFSLQNLPYNLGDTLVFSDYFSMMNIYTSLENCTVKMASVEVDDEEIDLSNEESYTFESRSDHTFKFYAESLDGQRCEGREVISIKVVDQDYLSYLQNDLGISLYGDLYVEDGNFTMIAGSYCNGNSVWLRRENGPHNLPYVAYNGDYGIDSYVKVDFTGNDMPILSFFRDDNYTQSIFDGTKGVVYTGGFTSNSGNAIHDEMCSRGTLYGPYMMHEYDRGAEDTTTIGSTSGSAAQPFAGSFKSLEDGTHYRMIAGFSGIRKGSANLLGTTTPVDTLFLTFECVIINLDTKEVFSKFEINSYGIQALGFQDIPVEEVDNSFFKGNIVMYGKHGDQTKLDKIYPVITGMSFDEICEEELTFSEFKDGAETFLMRPGMTLNVSDYVDTTASNYKFFYRDEEGNTYNVTGDTFSLENAGSYVFYYTDGTNLCATLSVFVADFGEELLGWVQDNNVRFYGLEKLSDEYSVTLKSGTIGEGANFPGPNAGNLINQSYMAFDGEYNLDDYIAFDFTGKNMPEVAFFAQNYNNSMYYQDGTKKGVLFVNGVTTYNGGLETGILGNGTMVNMDSPFMGQNIVDTWFVGNGCKESKLARANLEDGTHYRVILGFTKYNTAGIQLQWYLYNLDTNTVVEEGNIYTWNFFTGKEAKVNYMTYDDLFGSIVLYGKFGTPLTLDKVWGVFEDTTAEAVANGLNSSTKYTVTFKDMNGETIKTVTDVAFGEKVTYDAAMPESFEDAAFIYTYVWDKPFGKIAADTVYTMELASQLKEGVSTYNVSMGDKGVTFGKGTIVAGGTYTGPNATDPQKGQLIEQSYMAFDGEYAFDDYIVFDFTGKNMPEVAFFAKNYNSSMYYQDGGKQGVVVASGVTLWDGSLNNQFLNNSTQINISGPYMMDTHNATVNGGSLSDGASSKLARANLVDGKHYRVIMGFTKDSETAMTLRYRLYDLDTETLVEEMAITTYEVFGNADYLGSDVTTSMFSGSIVLYGKFGTTMTIDKFWGVYEDTTMEEIVAELV